MSTKEMSRPLSVRLKEVLRHHWPLLVATGIGLALRIHFLSQSMRGDESFTYIIFTLGGLTDLFYYPLPNNHVLHTVLVYLSTHVLGNSPEAIRQPAFLFGIMAIPLVYLVCRRLFSNQSGFAAAVLMAVHPYMVLYSTNARGYSALLTFTLLMILAGLRVVERPSLGRCFILALLGSLGLFAVPTMVFPLAGIDLWVLLLLLERMQDVRRSLREFVLPCGFMTVVLTALLYLPVFIVNGGFQQLFHNPFVRSQSVDVFIDGIPPHIWETITEYSRAIPIPALVCLAVLFGVGTVEIIRKKNWRVLSLAVSMTVASLVILSIQHAVPFARTWIFLLPISFLFMDQGFVTLLQNCAPRFRIPITNIVLLVVLMYAVNLSASPHIAEYLDPAIVPEGEMVAQFLQSEGVQKVKIHSRWDVVAVMGYYLYRKGIIVTMNSRAPSYYVANRIHLPIHVLTEEKVLRVFECGDAEVYVASPDGVAPVTPADVGPPARRGAKGSSG